MNAASPSFSVSFPSLLEAAEERSAVQQKLFYGVVGGQIIALAVAAAAALLPSDVLGGLGPIVVLIVFGGIILVQVSKIAEKAEREWYEARAASESIKAASWEYAVGGEAFRLSDSSSKERFRETLTGFLDQLTRLDVPTASRANASVTETMAELRASSLEVRRAVYVRDRVDDQLRWYSKKSNWNKRRARWGRISVIVVSLVALVLGIVRIRGHFDTDLMSVLVTGTTGIITWVQAKKYTQLSEAYSVTSHDISLLASAVQENRTEDEWAQFAHDAEAAFSREHTMWKARRQGPV
ncbi:DUF4231 domain-containing protein [Rhodococcoides fascians]|uniref:DUF4231 domain-containing protein n=1 Tax=Rhodococcoides fascians TaxID=1828 RepID=UPI0005652495|nr:DUF4231 domain-containing protein [Rhodococcus fascians]